MDGKAKGHGKQKAQCKECGGSSFCEHGKRKSICKECGGSAICEHGKQKAQCKECGAWKFCGRKVDKFMQGRGSHQLSFVLTCNPIHLLYLINIDTTLEPFFPAFG